MPFFFTDGERERETRFQSAYSFSSALPCCAFPREGTAFSLDPKVNLLCFFLKNIILFIFGCVWSLLVHRLFSSGRLGLLSSCCARPSHCSGFSCCLAQALGTGASVFVAHGLMNFGSQALEHRLNSCGVACGIFPDQ